MALVLDAPVFVADAYATDDGGLQSADAQFSAPLLVLSNSTAAVGDGETAGSGAVTFSARVDDALDAEGIETGILSVVGATGSTMWPL